jgi:Acetyltransferase (GNAT) family
MSVISLTDKLRHLVKANGWRSTGRTVWRHLIRNLFSMRFDTYYVFEKDLTKPMPAVEPKLDLEICKLEPSQQSLADLARFWPDYFRYSRSDNEIRSAISNYWSCGDECFFANFHGRIIAMSWIGYQNNYMLKSVAKTIGLRQNEVILHRAFVKPEFRGNNIYGCLLTAQYRYAKEKGYDRAYTYVGINNTGSILTHLRLCSKFRILHHLRITALGMHWDLFPFDRGSNQDSAYKKNG